MRFVEFLQQHRYIVLAVGAVLAVVSWQLPRYGHWISIFLAVAAVLAYFVLRPTNLVFTGGPTPEQHSLIHQPATQLRVITSGDPGSELGQGYCDLMLHRAHERNSDAAQVQVLAGRVKIGYLSSEMAQIVAPWMDSRGIGELRVPGRITADHVDVWVPKIQVIVPPDLYLQAAQIELPRSIDAWGTQGKQVAVSGESTYRGSIAAIFADAGVELDVNDQVLPDQCARLGLHGADIAVVVQGRLVGKLAAKQKERYWDVFTVLKQRGLSLSTTASVTARYDSDLKAQVRVRLPAPSEVLPPGPLPEQPYALLPGANVVEVVDEAEHAPTIRAILAGRLQCDAVATLHRSAADSPSADRVDVRLYGTEAGRLSQLQSKRYLPLILACEQASLIPVARARLVGDDQGVQVKLRLTPPDDIAPEWLSEAGITDLELGR